MYRIIKPSDELYHYGVKGMKWGVRRYQNYDGTRIGTGGSPVRDRTKVAGSNMRNTVAGGYGGRARGNVRLAASAGGSTGAKKEESKKTSTAEKVLAPSVKKGKGRDDTSVAQEASKHVLELDRSAQEIIKNAKESDPRVQEQRAKQEKSQRQKAREMSDKELRDSINRIKMEREYVSLTTKETKTGYDKALEITKKAEPWLKVATEIAGLVLLLYKIKNMTQSDDDMEGLYSYCVDNGFDSNIIQHATDLDLDYICDYYSISDDDLQHIIDNEDYLMHHGVKGMKWGVRRYQNYDGTRIGVGSGSGGGGGGSSKPRSIAGGGGPRLAAKAKTSKTAEIKKGLKAKYAEQKELGKAVKAAVTRPLDERRANAQAAHKEAADAIKNGLDKIVKDGHAEAFGDKPKVRADGTDESKFTTDQKRVSKDAKKDAEEFARAKAFYGEGAGNRRKAIKTTVEAKKKKNDFYAKEFEYHLSQQDMEEHMRKAKMERSQKDTAIGTRRALNKTNKALGQLSRFMGATPTNASVGLIEKQRQKNFVNDVQKNPDWFTLTKSVDSRMSKRDVRELREKDAKMKKAINEAGANNLIAVWDGKAKPTKETRAADAAIDDYNNTCRRHAKRMVGEYGDTRISSIDKRYNDQTIEDIVYTQIRDTVYIDAAVRGSRK